MQSFNSHGFNKCSKRKSLSAVVKELGGIMRLKYKIVDKDNNTKYQGYLLGELIETLILNQIKYLDNQYNSMTKIENNLYTYFCELSNCYNESSAYKWEDIKIIEIVYNNSQYIDEDNFIYFLRPKIKVTKKLKNINYYK